MLSVFSKLKNLSPLNPQIMVKNSLTVVEKLHFVWSVFYSEPPCSKARSGWLLFTL